MVSIAEAVQSVKTLHGLNRWNMSKEHLVELELLVNFFVAIALQV